MVLTCCVPFCKVRSDGSHYNSNGYEIVLHAFPCELNLLAKWIEAISQLGESKGSWSPSENAVVCGRHFEPSCFKENTKMSVLKEGSVPTIFQDHPICRQKRLLQYSARLAAAQTTMMSPTNQVWRRNRHQWAKRTLETKQNSSPEQASGIDSFEDRPLTPEMVTETLSTIKASKTIPESVAKTSQILKVLKTVPGTGMQTSPMIRVLKRVPDTAMQASPMVKILKAVPETVLQSSPIVTALNPVSNRFGTPINKVKVEHSKQVQSTPVAATGFSIVQSAPKSAYIQKVYTVDDTFSKRGELVIRSIENRSSFKRFSNASTQTQLTFERMEKYPRYNRNLQAQVAKYKKRNEELSQLLKRQIKINKMMSEWLDED